MHARSNRWSWEINSTPAPSWAILRNKSTTAAVASGSSIDVGSSQMRNAGSITSARAMQARCSWPSLTLLGKRSNRLGLNRARAAHSSTRRAICSVESSPAMARGSPMMVRSVQLGLQASRGCWLILTISVRRCVRLCGTGSLSIVTVPDVGASRPLRSPARVVFPDPEGPMSPRRWRRGSSSVMLSSTVVVPNRMVTLSARSIFCLLF